jgi:RNA polymerase sigma-70 factor (ECF subfamily)
VEQEIDRRELVKAIDTFLGTLSDRKQDLFVCRYWYFDSISTIASSFGMTENNVSVQLNRIRLKLHNYLLERGFEL